VKKVACQMRQQPGKRMPICKPEDAGWPPVWFYGSSHLSFQHSISCSLAILWCFGSSYLSSSCIISSCPCLSSYGI
jgi:hypothetical protein